LRKAIKAHVNINKPFRDWAKTNNDSDHKDNYPLLPNSMKNEIKTEIESSISEILDKY